MYGWLKKCEVKLTYATTVTFKFEWEGKWAPGLVNFFVCPGYELKYD